MKEKYRWQPDTPAQRSAIDSPAQLLFFGGSAGSLKTETLLMDAVQEYRNPNLNAIIFRSSFVEMTDIIRKTRRLYTPLGGKYNGSEHMWRFPKVGDLPGRPTGAMIRFAYMASDDDVWKLLGTEFSFIGFDESTLHTEFQVRNAISRLRSTDPTLRLRVRLASNPGSIGAAWHLKLFLHDHCPIHQPEEACVPGKVYTGCVWPSDGVAIPQSVCFIPGKLSDHNRLGDDYRKNLEQMTGAYAAAMAKGCWCTLAGQFFPFLNRDFIRPLAEAEVEWWHSHFLSIDYGFGKSSSSVGLYVRTPAEIKRHISIPGIRANFTDGEGFPEGRIRKIGELVVPHVPAYELAQMAIEAFVKPDENGQRRRIVAAYLDPANFKEIGDGHTIADQINEVLAPWDIVCERASNDRPGGWQMLYQMLRTGEFEICDNCPKAFESLRTRMHDDKKPGDIKKVPGDPLDDVADETRYALYTFIQQADKPRELILAEAVQHFDRTTAQGMTSSAIMYQKKAEELDRGEQPVRFGRRKFGMGMRRG